jgi:alkaline phosphatase D
VADICVLDTRQYRSPHPCGDGWLPVCAQADEPQRTMLGERQERWLDAQLRSANGTWQILAQQVLFSRFDSRSFPKVEVDVEIRRMDGWDGATAAQDRLLRALRDSKTANPVILTGDAHMAMAFDVREDWHNTKASPLAVEFMATSISSGGDGSPTLKNAEQIFSQNPHLKFLGNERGYTRHIVTPKRWQADHRVVERVSTPGAPASTRKSLVVEAGQPGLKDA